MTTPRGGTPPANPPRSPNARSARRVRAIFGKELRDFRRNRSLAVGMAIIPVVFCIQPLVAVLTLNSGASGAVSHEHVLLYMLGIPALVPSIAVAYAVYGLFVTCVGLFAHPGVASALIRPPDLIAQLIFTPLLAAWSIWIAILISTRASDVRVAQQLATLASLPSVAVTTVISLNVIKVSLTTALVAGAALLALDVFGWRAASAAFDREQLITGNRARRGRRTAVVRSAVNS